jgi:myo-inositol-1(or 4)-monophosphatase
MRPESHEGAAAETLHYLDAALAVAEQAGALLREGALAAHPAESKSTSNDLVTRFDRAAEELIVSGLSQRFPAHRVLAEEGGARSGAGTDPAAPQWIVDPLDGTTNFAHGLPLFSVSIALVIDGVIRVGVVAAPALGLTFSAGRGLGARRNGQRLRVSDARTLDRALLSTGFPYDRRTHPQNNFAEFIAVKKRAQGVRRLGSAALDLAMVAAGAFDGYWEMRLAPWDIAAGMLLVEEAGGRVSDWCGGPVDLARCEILATNGHIHDELAAVITSAPRLSVG